MKLHNKQLDKHLEVLQSYYYFIWHETGNDDWRDKVDSILLIREQLKKL